VRLPKEMPKKLEKLINIHADLAGNIGNLKTMNPEGYCKVALMEALKIVTRGTRLEGEALALIATCSEVFDEED